MTEGSRLTRPRVRQARTTGIDALDHEILRLLARQGRTPARRIAAAVALSEAAVAARLRRLQDRGVVTGYRMVLDYAALGRPWQAAIRVRLAPATDSWEFERHLRTIPAVVSAWQTTGDTDYEVFIACRDLADLDAVVVQLRDGAGGAQTSTHLVLHEVSGLGEALWSDG